LPKVSEAKVVTPRFGEISPALAIRGKMQEYQLVALGKKIPGGQSARTGGHASVVPGRGEARIAQ
jgi:hypothetical protein